LRQLTNCKNIFAEARSPDRLSYTHVTMSLFNFYFWYMDHSGTGQYYPQERQRRAQVEGKGEGKPRPSSVQIKNEYSHRFMFTLSTSNLTNTSSLQICQFLLVITLSTVTFLVFPGVSWTLEVGLAF